MITANASEPLAKDPAELSALDHGSACPHCQSGPQFYTMLFGLYKFDVDLAVSLVRDGRLSVELPEEDVRHSLEWSEIYPQHLDHVDLRYPGIVAHYWYPEKDGTLLQGHVLVDGHHRAAKAAQLGVPFYVYVLSEEESQKVTLRAPTIGGSLADDRLRHVDVTG
jgi:hypothetical protein